MPNFCQCVITVTGRVDKMKIFYDTIKEGDNYYLKFEKTVPIPGTSKHDDIWGGTATIWGTKWDLNEQEYEILDCLEDKYRIRCDTAWCPPIEWAKKASKIFDINIKIAYAEYGIGFYGLFEKNIDEKTTKNDEYLFLGDDIRATDEDYNDKNFNIMNHLNGRLKSFMKEHELTSLGG